MLSPFSPLYVSFAPFRVVSAAAGPVRCLSPTRRRPKLLCSAFGVLPGHGVEAGVRGQICSAYVVLWAGLRGGTAVQCSAMTPSDSTSIPTDPYATTTEHQHPTLGQDVGLWKWVDK